MMTHRKLLGILARVQEYYFRRTWANMTGNFLSNVQLLFDLWTDNNSIPTAVDLQF